MTRRHPAQVTADRLGEAIEQWPGRFTKGEIEAVQSIAARLLAIAEHDRSPVQSRDDGWRCSCGASVLIPGAGRAQLDRLFTDHITPPTTEETPA